MQRVRIVHQEFYDVTSEDKAIINRRCAKVYAEALHRTTPAKAAIALNQVHKDYSTMLGWYRQLEAFGFRLMVSRWDGTIWTGEPLGRTPVPYLEKLPAGAVWAKNYVQVVTSYIESCQKQDFPEPIFI